MLSLTMPRITAPTVAEHRARQRAAVLAAGADLVAEGGVDALTVSAVAARTGLARPSVYAYFGSADALLGALVAEAFERWRRAIEAADLPGDDPDAAVRGWFAVLAASAAAGDHRLARGLDRDRLPDDVRADVGAGHRATSAPLVRAAEALGAPADRALPLLLGVAATCIDRVEQGADPAAEAPTAAAFALGGLRALVP